MSKLNTYLYEYCVFIKVDTGFDKFSSPVAVFFREDLAQDYVSCLNDNNIDLAISYFVKSNREEENNEKK